MEFEKLAQYWPVAAPWRISHLTGGSNNLNLRVQTPGPEQYVLRIYQNQTRPAFLKYEFQVLAELQPEGLPFQVPAPLKTTAGEDFIWLEKERNPSFVALWPFVPGKHPRLNNLKQAFEAGIGLAKLDQALSRIEVKIDEHIQPRACQSDLYRCHPLVPDPLQAVRNLGISSGWKAALEQMVEEVVEARPVLFASLPLQIVHGDYDPSNILLERDRLTGVLDFEFCGPDLRAMDLAVTLLSFGLEMDRVEMVAKGFKSLLQLTEPELLIIPFLIKVQAAISFIHRLGRYRQGLENEDQVIKKAGSTLEFLDWLKLNEKSLLQVLTV